MSRYQQCRLRSHDATKCRERSSDVLFSVVIPTYNRPDHVRGVLTALADQHFPRTRFEVILVDDGGEHPLDDIVLSFRDRLTIVLLRQSNAGCAAARQRGVDSARGEFLVFTDDDCRPDAEWLNLVASAVVARPHCGFGGRTINAISNNPFSETTQIAVDFLMESGRISADEIQFCPTSNVAFPAAEFEEMGGLDKTWPVGGGEDRDLCSRWIEAGFRLLFLPESRVYHVNQMNFRQFIRRHFNYGRGAFIYHRNPASGRSRKHPFEPWSHYFRLLFAPFRASGFARGLLLLPLVFIAQGATGCGILFQSLISVGMLRFRCPAASTDDSTDPPKNVKYDFQ